MKKYLYLLLLGAAILAGVVLGPGGDVLLWLAWPFTALGALLRNLSLSGGIGNALSICLFALVSLAPLYGWCRSRRRAEDWLLVAMALVLGFVLYLMVNPGLRPALMQNEVGDVLYAGAIWSLAITWGILKLLRSGEDILSGNIYRALRIFLLILAAELLVTGIAGGFSSLWGRMEALDAGNTMPGVRLGTTKVFFVVDFLVSALEKGLLSWILLKSVNLLKLLETEPYSGEALRAGLDVGNWCRNTLAAVSLSSLALNLGQVFFAARLHNIDLTVRIPVGSLALAFGILALTRLLTAGKELKDDNDLFI